MGLGLALPWPPCKYHEGQVLTLEMSQDEAERVGRGWPAAEGQTLAAEVHT